jgi:hypothetical protein
MILANSSENKLNEREKDITFGRTTGCCEIDTCLIDG